MIPCNPINRKIASIVFAFSLFFCLKVSAQSGQQLFNQNCAACHNVFKKVIGPPLANFQENGPWADRNNVYEWVHNSDAFLAKNAYAKDLRQTYGVQMTHFPDLSNEQIDAIIDYINKAATEGPTAGPKPTPNGPGQPTGENKTWIIFGIISLIMAIIALILMQVNSNLKKLSDDHESILRPEPVAFYRNKIYIALVTIILFILGGYFLTKGAIGLGRQETYQPKQPIYFAHKVHAGINQIN
jgi:cytochrome c2